MEKPKIEDFYPLTPEISQKLRKANLTAAEWRFWAYLTEIDRWGDRYKELEPLTIMAECGMSKPTYYRAKAKFQELGLFDFQEEKVSFRNLTGVSFLRQQSQESNSDSKNETDDSKKRQNSQKSNSQSQKREKRKPKALPNKDSGTLQTYSDLNSDLNSDVDQTLSEAQEREKNFLLFKESLSIQEFGSFWDYALEVAKSFKEGLRTSAIRLPEAWIKAHYQELYTQFLDQLEKQYGSRNFQEILVRENFSANL